MSKGLRQGQFSGSFLLIVVEVGGGGFVSFRPSVLSNVSCQRIFFFCGIYTKLSDEFHFCPYLSNITAVLYVVSRPGIHMMNPSSQCH
jgi:hypothetical protein